MGNSRCRCLDISIGKTPAQSFAEHNTHPRELVLKLTFYDDALLALEKNDRQTIDLAAQMNGS